MKPKSGFFCQYSIFQSSQKITASHFSSEIISIIQFYCAEKSLLMLISANKVVWAMDWGWTEARIPFPRGNVIFVACVWPVHALKLWHCKYIPMGKRIQHGHCFLNKMLSEDLFSALARFESSKLEMKAVSSLKKKWRRADLHRK